jgi:hypothetical protein
VSLWEPQTSFNFLVLSMASLHKISEDLQGQYASYINPSNIYSCIPYDLNNWILYKRSYRSLYRILNTVTYIYMQDVKIKLYGVLAEIPGVARVDHRTKCVSMVAISLSHIFVNTNCWPAV